MNSHLQQAEVECMYYVWTALELEAGSIHRDVTQSKSDINMWMYFITTLLTGQYSNFVSPYSVTLTLGH